MINCEKTKELMSDFIENEIDPEMKKEVTQHLNICPPCKKMFARTKELLESMSSFTPYSVSNNFDKDLEIKLARLRKTEKNSNRNSFIKGAFIGAAAAGLIFFSFNGNDSVVTSSAVNYSVSSMNNKLSPAAVIFDSTKVDTLQNANRIKKDLDKNLQMVSGRN